LHVKGHGDELDLAVRPSVARGATSRLGRRSWALEKGARAHSEMALEFVSGADFV